MSFPPPCARTPWRRFRVRAGRLTFGRGVILLVAIVLGSVVCFLPGVIRGCGPISTLNDDITIAQQSEGRGEQSVTILPELFVLITPQGLTVVLRRNIWILIIDRGMLLPYLKQLSGKKVILGSQSKSRNELMTAQRLPYQVVPSKFAEDLPKENYKGRPEEYNRDTCGGKVAELLQRFEKEGIEWDLLICGDTILEHNGEIIEKPENYEHCIRMMEGLSGQTHRVYTAHAVVFNEKKYAKGYREEWVAKAEVTFGDIPREVLECFAKEPQPYRHSGGYELTAMSGSFLREIKGSHSAVQGLDMYSVCSHIMRGGRQLEWW